MNLCNRLTNFITSGDRRFLNVPESAVTQLEMSRTIIGIHESSRDEDTRIKLQHFTVFRYNN